MERCQVQNLTSYLLFVFTVVPIYVYLFTACTNYIKISKCDESKKILGSIFKAAELPGEDINIKVMSAVY